ncbi:MULTISPECIES: S1 family peptidase [unclassified Conexibacter]|uniref:S1 family peptidase n=1 Tax=unclassified Conexibacter TaxID=2627773 RepID=UPI00272014EA|nr:MULTISPECIES: S1 family peptidase [unclassified Conexibacter]MDO8189035.1 S1 family peptidase [Conexibacter sp. CPCC 205706]MDO8198524.1 S1 family peptidase [Conexibacter sp. CPCC 205762]
MGSAQEVLIQTLGQQSPPAAAEVESLAEHDGISVEQATRSLEVQHRAGDITTELRAALGEDFAGVWYDREAATFQIGVVDGKGEDAARRVAAAKQVPARLVPVRYTAAQLTGVAARWSAAHPDLLARAAINVNIDYERNTVVARVGDDTSTEALGGLQAEARRGAPGTVRIETVAAEQLKVEPLACNIGTHGCDLPMRGGIKISNAGATCTGGFMTQGNGGANYFLLTAGHCLNSAGRGAAVSAYTYNGSAAAFGVVHNFVYNEATGTDAGIVRWTNTGWPIITNSVVAWTIDENRVITGTYEATPGVWICHSGIHTNIQCGYTAGPANSSGIVAVQTCGDHGDSGGPFINGNLAGGVAAFATPIACGPTFYTYYQQQNWANSLMNVHLL